MRLEGSERGGDDAQCMNSWAQGEGRASTVQALQGFESRGPPRETEGRNVDELPGGEEANAGRTTRFCQAGGGGGGGGAIVGGAYRRLGTDFPLRWRKGHRTTDCDRVEQTVGLRRPQRMIPICCNDFTVEADGHGDKRCEGTAAEPKGPLKLPRAGRTSTVVTVDSQKQRPQPQRIQK